MLRLLLAAVLLVLSPPLARAGDDPQYQVIWKDAPRLHQRFGGVLDASSPRVVRAAQVAVWYFNFQRGSPSSLRVLSGPVKRASLKVIPGVGRKYFLQFATRDLGELVTRDLHTLQKPGMCSASVFYRKTKPKPLVEIECSNVKDLNQQTWEDYRLYFRIIGNSKYSQYDLLSLANLGSSYIAWEKSTEDSSYSMLAVENIKHWKREDDSLEFDYTVVLHNEALEPTISCHTHLVWMPKYPVKVKYDCSSEEPSGSADGSGMEPGSANGFLIEPESNF
ncbi:retinoic acid receptor responder protein 1 [Hemicordylus capensis]|uniref:retinoic acid receptor responder protein 1 n=1 Tax=Hemicordylus capensis TaxID=884348 RepID=UPI0023023D35|nr:retinoic acid receptor responder protein 1 [Hemicordylus capensis]